MEPKPARRASRGARHQLDRHRLLRRGLPQLGSARLQDPGYFICHEDHDLGLRAGQLGHRILAVPEALCRHGKGTPGLSPRASGSYSAKRAALIIGNRWRILLTRYELRTLVLLVPALLLFELIQLGGSMAKGWASSWLAALAPILHDLLQIAHERRQWVTHRRFGDGRVLEGGPLPFYPCLLTGPVQLAAGGCASAVPALIWRIVRRFLRDAPAATR